MKSMLWMIPLVVAGCSAPRKMPAPAMSEEPLGSARFENIRRPIGVRVLDVRSSAEASSGLAARTLEAIVSLLEQGGVEVQDDAPVGIEITLKSLAPEHRADVRLSCARVLGRWYELNAEFAPGGVPFERCISEGSTHGPTTDLPPLYAAFAVGKEVVSPQEDEGSQHAFALVLREALVRMSWIAPPSLR